MKAKEPCREFVSRNPGAGAHYPDPCKTCGWSSPDHDSYWRERDLKNGILLAVNEALDDTGFSIARATIDGEDSYNLVKLPTVVQETPPEVRKYYDRQSNPIPLRPYAPTQAVSNAPPLDTSVLLRALETLEEVGWVIERDMASRLHYWTGRPDSHAGQWSMNHADALRFARRTDAECMLTWYCSDNGRVVEHLWSALAPPVEKADE